MQDNMDELLTEESDEAENEWIGHLLDEAVKEEEAPEAAQSEPEEPQKEENADEETDEFRVDTQEEQCFSMELVPSVTRPQRTKLPMNSFLAKQCVPKSKKKKAPVTRGINYVKKTPVSKGNKTSVLASGGSLPKIDKLPWDDKEKKEKWFDAETRKLSSRENKLVIKSHAQKHDFTQTNDQKIKTTLSSEEKNRTFEEKRRSTWNFSRVSPNAMVFPLSRETSGHLSDGLSKKKNNIMNLKGGKGNDGF